MGPKPKAITEFQDFNYAAVVNRLVKKYVSVRVKRSRTVMVSCFTVSVNYLMCNVSYQYT